MGGILQLIGFGWALVGPFLFYTGRVAIESLIAHSPLIFGWVVVLNVSLFVLPGLMLAGIGAILSLATSTANSLPAVIERKREVWAPRSGPVKHGLTSEQVAAKHAADARRWNVLEAL